MAPKGTIAIEEAVLDPRGIGRHAKDAALYAPAYGPGQDLGSENHPLTAALLDIHKQRLEQMDAHGVEYMLLSLTSPAPRGRKTRPRPKSSPARQTTGSRARQTGTQRVSGPWQASACTTGRKPPAS